MSGSDTVINAYPQRAAIDRAPNTILAAHHIHHIAGLAIPRFVATHELSDNAAKVVNVTTGGAINGTVIGHSAGKDRALTEAFWLVGHMRATECAKDTGVNTLCEELGTAV